MVTKEYNHKEIESKWQRKWEEEGLYNPDILKTKDPFYNLWMFPYPSGEGLHAGHAFASTGSDIYGRFMRMNGRDVFQPIGYDSFGIHSENFAIKINQTPQEMLARTTKHYERQLRSLGHGYDWKHTVTTSAIDYYKWTQWLFVQIFKAGLAHKMKAKVNWCPFDKTVLADEQVIDGKCERCGNLVEKKELEQWFFRITDYADRLLKNLDKINWSERVKVAQKNWIGRSEGVIIDFKIEGKDEVIRAFTTRPDTLESATFIAIAGQKASKERRVSKEKTGKFTGNYAVNPANGERLPIWETNYVEESYGTGAIMGVPAYDERDMEFSKKYKIDVVKRKLNLGSWGKKHTSYHLRDWLISRQRYWGPPIPMIFCGDCKGKGRGWFSENRGKIHNDQSDWDWHGWWPEEDLPVELPKLTDYKPEGTGRGPLANHPEFYKTKCPSCGGQATRETDVSDTFVDSSWYFLRYPSVGSESADTFAFDIEITRKWLPVDLYFGGAEHSVLHLMYARFVTQALFDLKLIDFEEPFPRFFAHGLMIKEGAKMSKSKGNVVNPDQYIERFGADALRLYLMFIGPMDANPDFRDTGIEGMRRFVSRLWNLFSEYKDIVLTDEKDSREVLFKMHQTTKKVTKDIQGFKYNTAISAIMEFVNLLQDKAGGKVRRARGGIRCAEWDEALKTLVKLLAPFAPHMAEEIWQTVLNQSKVGQKSVFNSIHLQPWPKFDVDLSKEKENVIVVQVDGKVRSTLSINYQQSTIQQEIEKLAKENPKVAKWLEEKKVKKVVFVPGKLINFVT